MKDALAEKLLAQVLQWSAEDVARERPILQALAAYKYDDYEQFSAGSRFVENLTLWLNQFKTADERRIAYDFVKTRLVFCSVAEMRHLVEIAYPDYIRPILLRRIASEFGGISRYHVSKIAAQAEFKIWQRQCLFLGLSDGARIDAFRRANNRDLNHEQIWQTYELSERRVTKLLKKLDEHLQQLNPGNSMSTNCKFRTFVLLDDFSASGTSYYSLPANGEMSGKIASFFMELCDSNSPVSKLVDLEQLEVIILLYMATEQAREHLKDCSDKLWGSRKIRCDVEIVQQLPRDLRLTAADENPLTPLIRDYYDHGVFDQHFEKGGTDDARYGYAACGLPLVLHHNTPNNSIALLWSGSDMKFRGLFPRVPRHKEML